MADVAQTTSLQKKVVASTGGAAAGSAVSTILLWFLTSSLGSFHITLPAEVSAAFGTLFTTVATLAAGYYVPPGENETTVLDQNGQVRAAVVRPPVT